MPALVGVRLERLQQRGEVVGLRGVEAGLGPSATVVVLADEHLVFEDHLGLARRRVNLERDVREEISLVEAVPVDLEDATDMRLVVGVIVEFHPIDLDGAVVARRIGARLAGNGRDQARRSPEHAGQADDSPPTTVDQLTHSLLPCSAASLPRVPRHLDLRDGFRGRPRRAPRARRARSCGGRHGQVIAGPCPRGTGAYQRSTSAPSTASTVTVSPSPILPSRSSIASLSASSRWITRLRGRAPNEGS
jgi:hypothetical protein